MKSTGRHGKLIVDDFRSWLAPSQNEAEWCYAGELMDLRVVGVSQQPNKGVPIAMVVSNIVTKAPYNGFVVPLNLFARLRKILCRG